MKKKYVFVGDVDSINIEIIEKSHDHLKDKAKYILIGEYKKIKKYLEKILSKKELNIIIDPFNFENLDKNKINIFDIKDLYSQKYKNLINQIQISNYLSNKTGIDLVTMPIEKSLFKKKIKFIGMTEYLGEINKVNTYMLMFGESFSIVPFTTHINPKNIYKYIINKRSFEENIKDLLKIIKKESKLFNFKDIRFLCYNPHCGEDGTIGKEDKIINKIINKYKTLSGPYAADSAFTKYNSKTLFLTTYHDQGLVPFKILNKTSVNITLGLKYRRLSPTHGTAKDIKFKNLANNTSYLECMKI